MAVARLGKQSGESLHVHQGNPSKVTGASARGRRPCRCGSELRADETTADGVTDQARRVVDIELRHDPGPVILRGLDAHAPEPSDLFRCLSLHHQLQDLALAWTQRIGRNLSLRQVRLDHGPGDARAQVDPIGPYDAAALLSTTQIVDAEAKHLPWGTPACSRIFFHVEYVLCYDVGRKVALWDSYRLEATDVVDANRVNAFRTDPRLPIDQNASCDDYAGSGFDRGHMVPRSDMNRSQVAMVNTFFLTNMTPQRPNVNQGAWARLEDWVRAWAKASGWVHVISGSVFDDDDDQQPDDPADAQLSHGSSGAGVPSHYYKIIIREASTGRVEAITLLIPNALSVPGRNSQDTTKDNYLRNRIRTITEIRRRTGLDLIPSPPFDKATLEQAVASNLWPRN